MYNIREKVSDEAGRKLAVFKAARSTVSGKSFARGLTNAEALDMILCALPAIEQIIDEQFEAKQND